MPDSTSAACAARAARTGMLVYVSLLERMAEILVPDDGGRARRADDGWKRRDRAHRMSRSRAADHETAKAIAALATCSARACRPPPTTRTSCPTRSTMRGDEREADDGKRTPGLRVAGSSPSSRSPTIAMGAPRRRRELLGRRRPRRRGGGGGDSGDWLFVIELIVRLISGGVGLPVHRVPADRAIIVAMSSARSGTAQQRLEQRAAGRAERQRRQDRRRLREP